MSALSFASGSGIAEMIPEQAWVYRAKAVYIVDGDTVDVWIDAGFHGYRRERLRLLGVNAPEMHGASKAYGVAARLYVGDWLNQVGDWPLIVQTERSDVFGRFLATVWRVSDGACLNDDLLASGKAVPFK
jgi:micrococcal nuclease